jgi:hypothetical protein
MKSIEHLILAILPINLSQIGYITDTIKIVFDNCIILQFLII